MQLEHKFSVPASRDVVWQALLDPERVAPCMPGATVQSVDGSSFSGTVKVKLGPVSLMYKGSGEFIETDEASNKVVIKASGKDSRGNGTAAATVTVVLTENGSSTDGAVTTDLNITGKPAQFGRGMIADVGGKILDSFASCLAEKLGGDAGDATAGDAGAEAAGTAEASSGGAATRKPSPTPRPKPDPAGQAEPVQPRQQVPQPERLDADEPTPASLAAEQQTVAETKPAESKPAKPRQAAAQPEAEPIDLFEYAGASVAKRAVPAVIGLLAVVAAIIFWRRNR